MRIKYYALRWSNSRKELKQNQTRAGGTYVRILNINYGCALWHSEEYLSAHPSSATIGKVKFMLIPQALLADDRYITSRAQYF